MKFVEVNNATYAYKVHQRDENLPRLLMLHGFMGDHRVFEHLIAELCECCNPISVDLLGHGKSSKPTDPDRYNESQQVDDILSLIQKLNLSRLVLFGYSMGGRLALKTVLASSNTFKGLILESTNCGIADKSKRKERRQTDEQRALAIENNFEDFLAKWKELPLFQSPLLVNEELGQKYYKIQQQQDPAAMAASLRGFGTGSMTPVCDDLKQLDLPVLLLAGSNDEKYQRINRFLVNQLPEAKFSSIPAGHRIHLDNPSGYLQELKSFFDENFNN